MELNASVVAVVAVVAVLSLVLIRWGFRREPAAPVDVRDTPVKSSAIAAREERQSQPLVNWLLERASEQTGVRMDNDALARDRIVKAAVEAMEVVQRGGSATISLPFLTADAQGPKHFTIRFKRNPDSTFELLV